MGKYTDAPDSIIEKRLAGLMQLEAAIDLFLNEKFVAAITLAGAADGIFSGLLNEQRQRSPLEDAWSHIEEVRGKTGLAFAGTRTRKQAIKEWNELRNNLKHHDGGDPLMLRFNEFDVAYEAIERANYGAEQLDLVARNRGTYRNWLIDNICTL